MTARCSTYALCVAAALVPTFAFADESEDAALDAYTVAQEFCGTRGGASKADAAITANKAVADSLDRLNAVYGRTQNSSLLYWRGVLEQCSDLSDLAARDLEAFVAAQEKNPLYQQQVAEAKARLRRLKGVQSGGGDASKVLGTSTKLGIAFRYGFGLALRTLACTDDGSVETGRALSATCAGAANATTLTGVQVAPALGQLQLRLWFAERSSSGSSASSTLTAGGLGVDARLDALLQSTTVDPGNPGPVFDLDVGPAIRHHSGLSPGGRAFELRVLPRAAITLRRHLPWAGSPKYQAQLGFLDAGSTVAFSVGGGISVDASFEAAASTIVEVGGDVGLQATLHRRARSAGPRWVGIVETAQAQAPVDAASATPCADLPAPDDPARCEEVASDVLPGGGLRLRGGGSFSVQRAVAERGLRVGPMLAVDAALDTTDYGDVADRTWQIDTGATGDGDARTISSTRRFDFGVRLGVVVRWGG